MGALHRRAHSLAEVVARNLVIDLIVAMEAAEAVVAVLRIQLGEESISKNS